LLELNKNVRQSVSSNPFRQSWKKGVESAGKLGVEKEFKTEFPDGFSGLGEFSTNLGGIERHFVEIDE
jgi:hypothetical protein